MCPDNIITPTWTLMVRGEGGLRRKFKMSKNVILIPLPVNQKGCFILARNSNVQGASELGRISKGNKGDFITEFADRFGTALQN